MHPPTYLLLALVGLHSAAAAPAPGKPNAPHDADRRQTGSTATDRYLSGREPKVMAAVPLHVWGGIMGLGAAIVGGTWMGVPPNDAQSLKEATPRSKSDVPAYFSMDRLQRQDYFSCYHHRKTVSSCCVRF
jgi:hypothetical protein